MTVSYGGSITLGQAIPTALSAAGALTASLTPPVADAQARLAGMVALSVSPPPSLAELIAAVQALLAALQALLSAPLPDVDAQAAAIAELQASLTAMQLALDLGLDLTATLGSPGIHYYTFAGAAQDLGSDMSSELSSGLPGGGGPSEQIAGAILLARDAGAIAALQAVMKQL